MASISYWVLSPSFVMALLGKLRGWDRVAPTPAYDWRKATVDVVVPARNEAGTVAFALESLLAQEVISTSFSGSSPVDRAAIRCFRLA